MNRTLLWITMAIFVSVGCLPTSGGDPADLAGAAGSAQTEPTPLDPDDPLLRDAASYAEDMGVSLEEAVQRLAFQQTIGDIQPALESELAATYGGLWVEHEPEYHIVIALTDGDEESIQQFIEGKPWAEFVQVRLVEYTLRQLRDAQSQANEAADSVQVSVSSGVNVMENRVEVFVGNPELFRSDLEAAGLQLPSPVSILAANPDRPLPASNQAVMLEATTEDGRIIYLPKLPPANESMAALLEGTLFEENGCLRLAAEGYDNGFFLLWPYDSELRLEGGAIEVFNGEGQIVARVGESLRVGGGAMESASAIARLDEVIPGMPIDGCSGPYWVAGELETMAEQSVADVYVNPFSSGDQMLAIFIFQSRAADDEGTLTGELVVDDGGCLQINEHTILWPPDVFPREEPLRLVGPGETPIAAVGDQITVTGGLKGPEDYRFFENKVQCPGPYWGAAAVHSLE